MRYVELCDAYAAIENTAGRLEKTRIIAELLANSGQDLERVILLLQGRAFPAWDKQKIGVSTQLILKAISRVSGATTQQLEKAWSKQGDLGIVAQEHITGKTQQTLFTQDLTVQYVHEQIKRLATIEGSGSVEVKLQTISELLSQSSPIEARYLSRTILETLRIGIATQTIRDAIIYAFLSDEAGIEEGQIKDREKYNSIASMAQSAYDKTNDFTTVARAAQKGSASLKEIGITIGIPLKVMLGLKGTTTKQAMEALGPDVLLQYKYDGFRVEIHKDGEHVTVFTRRLEDVTEQFPDVAKRVLSHVKCKSCILDGEAIGIDPASGRYRPFQEISQRIKRKHGVDDMAKRLPVDLRFFDIMALDGEETIDKPLSQRHELLKSIVDDAPLIGVAHTLITSDVNEAERFYDQALAAGEEGLFAKKLNSIYQPGTRVGNWIKLKSTMEPLDLAIVAAEWGEGKRSGWLTSFVLACQDETGNLLEIGRVATGLKEKREEGFSFPEITELLEPLVEYTEGRMVTVKPEIVLEVAYEEIQASPQYGSGYALRFPRVLRNRTDERSVEDASTLAYVEQLYHQQRG